MQNKSGRVVVVFGPGRSGTSLLMQILGRIGLKLSDHLIGPHYENQDGFFEDSLVIDLHKKFLNEIGAMPLLPLPDGWKDNAINPSYRNQISTIVSDNVLKSSPSIWGVKDPRLSSLLPLWVPVFKSLWIVPCLILAIRNPSEVVRSLMKQANISPHLAELVWLSRTCDALINSEGNCHIVHYEEWFTDPYSVAKNLLSFTGLKDTFDLDLSKVMDGVIKKNLNRSSLDEYQICNPLVIRLYAALRECHGSDFDRDVLMSVVKECRQAMDGFKGWHQLANDSNKKLADMKLRLEKSSAEVAKLKLLETQVKALEKERLQSEQLADQVKKLQWQLDHLVSFGPLN